MKAVAMADKVSPSPSPSGDVMAPGAAVDVPGPLDVAGQVLGPFATYLLWALAVLVVLAGVVVLLGVRSSRRDVQVF